MFLGGVVLGCLGTAIFGPTLAQFTSEGFRLVNLRDHPTQAITTSKTNYSATERNPTSTIPTTKIATSTATSRADRLDFPQGATWGQRTLAVRRSAPPRAEGGAKTPVRSMPFPETKPTTIQGWTVRDVVGGTAVLEGPDGVRSVTRGDTVPELGEVNSIVRWGSHWIVATSRGLVSTP